MHSTLVLVLSLICMSTILLHQTDAACDVCSKNGVACASKNTYYLCYNEKPDKASAFSCPAGQICTATQQFKCMSETSSFPPGCPEPTTVKCDSCGPSGRLFTCTSHTTFAQCSNKAVTGKCPEGLFCNTSKGGELCISECKAKNTETGTFDCESTEEIPLV